MACHCPQLGWDLPSFINPMQKFPYKYSQSFDSWVLLDELNLAIDIAHYTLYMVQNYFNY